MNVVVTGSTSGIGLNIALGFLAKGHSVVVNGLCSDLEALKKFFLRTKTVFGIVMPT
jgi:NAD(P)-dependent dehydrogenase (short-subunit alcohol dehydrogenase family)